MSPLDDELRATLHGRARVLAPSPDPMAGIQTRARRMQRRRVGVAVAGSALAVALVAAVVPAVQSGMTPQPEVPRFASAQPRLSPPPATSTPAPGMPANAVQWAGSALLDPALDGAYLDQWQAVHGRTGQKVSGQVLFRGETDDGVQVHVYQLWSDGQPAHAVVGYSSEAGPELARDTVLAPQTLVVDAVVPGGALPAVVIAHDPTLPTVQYSGDGRTFTTIDSDDPAGVITPRTAGPDAPDRIRLLDAQGEVAYDEPLWTPGESDGNDGSGEPAAALDPEAPWEPRGEVSLLTEEQLSRIGVDFAERRGVDRAGVQVVPLYVQRLDDELLVVYLIRSQNSTWFWGGSISFEDGWSLITETPLAPGTAALAALVPRGDLDPQILVVAAPSMGGAVYALPGKQFRPMDDLAPGVFGVIDQHRPGTRYKVLDGDGDLDNPAAQGEVPPYQSTG